MSALGGLLARARAVFRRDVTEADLDEEIRFHIERETEKNIRNGMPAHEARRQALLAFGGVAQAKENHRAVRGVPLLEEAVADARYALRALRRGPTLAAAAIITLALGIGANTAIFSAVNAVILRPLPLPDPDRLVMLWEQNPDRGWYKNVAAPANYLDWREQVPAFEDVAGSGGFPGRTPLSGDGEPVYVQTATVTGNYFSVLGVSAQMGRTLRDEETWAPTDPVVVISNRLWRQRFGSDPAIIGRTIQIGSGPRQIVGVMPETFDFPYEGTDLWLPMAWDRAEAGAVRFRRAHWMRPVARLKPGVTIEQADAQLQQVVRRLQADYPATNTNMGAGMTPLHEFLVGDTRTPLLVLLGAVGLLLLIACVNVGNLLLVRAGGRERETALRLALGADRMRLVRQALTESLVLSVLGGVAGLALGWAGTRMLTRLQPERLLRVSNFEMDWTVMAFVFAITTVSGLLFGIAPSLWAGRRVPADALREGGRTGSDGRRMRRWGDSLVVAEVAVAVLLAIGAGLLVRSFNELRDVHPGIDPNGVMTMELGLPATRYDSAAKITAFFNTLVERTRTLPGVTNVALVSQLPLTRPSWSSDFIAEGRAIGEHGTEVLHREASPSYFATMRVPLLQGRDFSASDTRESPPVVIVNDALVRSYFGTENPIGKRIAFDRVPDSTSFWRTIVGVVGDEHQGALGEPPRMEIFAPVTQDVRSVRTLVARSSGDPAALAPALRAIVRDLDPNLAIIKLEPMTEVASRSLALQRYLMVLFLLFAGVGVALAVVGVYGVLAQVTKHRTREMGIRIALGARVRQVRWLIVREGLRLTIIGLALGSAFALIATRAMSGLLFNIPVTDPWTFAGVAMLVALAGLAASFVPAVHASRADPALALRGE